MVAGHSSDFLKAAMYSSVYHTGLRCHRLLQKGKNMHLFLSRLMVKLDE